MLIETAIARALYASGLPWVNRNKVLLLNLFNASFGPSEGSTIIVRPVQFRGKMAYQDNTLAIRVMLEFVGCKRTEGNDAPRGGKLGNWISFDRNEFLACLEAKTGFTVAGFENQLYSAKQ